MPFQRNIKFLLVDDLESNLMALEGLLRREGLELLKAHSGPEALELLLVHEVALAFVDVQMPGMGGFELAELMRSTDRTRAVPIIFLTAGTVDQQRRIRGYETGAVDFLPKPIDPSILLNKAEIFYQLARQREDLRESEIRLRDANERLAKSNAELERADRSKDQFLAMLAHELRNPLAPILTGVDVLLQSPRDPALIEKIGNMMKRQTDQMAHLINDLLDVSRIATGKIELRKVTAPVAEIVEKAVESVQPLIEKFEHELVIENGAVSLLLEADHYRLAQVVSNLLSNAAKYTPPQGRIVLSVQKSQNSMLRISVKDNGKGICVKHQERVFELFDQGASGHKDGLGIGLTLVKSLVEMHGGTISLVSEGEGKGSEFIVEVPGVEHSPESSIEESPSQPKPKGKMRVLIADDGKSTADILEMFFRMEGLETAVAYNGRDAVEEATRFFPELVCLDLGMPELDGYSAARYIREICPDAYIVALSGWGSDEDRRKTTEAGFNEHLVKPVSPGELRELVSRMPGR
jgi:signal transduction histidine kinase